MFDKTIAAVKEGYRAYRSVQYSEKFNKWISNLGESVSGAIVNEDTAFNIATVYSCVNLISQTIGSLPLKLYKKDGEGRLTADAHYLYDILHNRPNPYMLPSSFKETLQAHVLTWGGGYAEIEFDVMGRPLHLWPIHASRVYPKLVKGEMIYDIYITGGDMRTLPASKILHIPGLSFDGIRGTTPIQKARETFGNALAAQEYGSRFFSGDATPNGVAVHPGVMGDKAYERLQKSLREGRKGLKGQHRIMLLEEAVQYTKVGLSPEDGQLLDTQKFSGNQICGMFRVPPHMVGIMDRATFCLPEDVEVSTQDGPKKITEIVKGEKVWSFTDKGPVLSAVKHVVCSGTDNILKIKTTNRTIRCNSAHRILARKKTSSPTSGPGGYQHIEWATAYIPAGELKTGDVIVALNGLPESGNDIAPNGRKLTLGFMEFCGILLGDGTVSNGHVSIACSNTARYKNHYKKIAEQEFVAYDGGNGQGDKTKTPKKKVVITDGDRSFRFASILAASELRLLGFSGVAYTKAVPGWVFGLNSDLRAAFVRGFVEADGSVDKKGRISCGSVNNKMLSQFRHLVMGLGIPVTNMLVAERNCTLPNGKKHSCIFSTFTCSDPAANLKIGSHDPKDMQRLLSGKGFERKNRKYPRYGGAGFSDKSKSLSRIVSIGTEKEEPVYDLEVEGTHNFIANGVVVHNSNIEQQALEFMTGCIYPWTKKWEEAINLRLVMEAERKTFYAEFVSDGYLRGDIAARTAYYSTGIQNGWLSVNDIRRKENMNPVPGGDKYFRQLNLIGLDAPNINIGGKANEEKQAKN